MSYRELRDFTEHMKALGYPSALSIESFRQPNFPLVASLLLFLLRRYDPTLVPPEDISTQSARIAFIQSVTAMLLSKCHLKLSMKQLYKADGYAVKELLKLSSTLYQAMNASSAAPAPLLQSTASTSPSDAAQSPASFDSFRDAKALAADLIDLGERLSTLLSHEPTVRPAREQALLFVDSISGDDPRGQTVERSIRKQMQLMADNVKELKANRAQLLDDCEKVRGRLERKEAERERMEKRWKALRSVKPQFLEEFEREERELRAVYAVYVERARNVQWLEGEMRELRREEEEEKKESERRLSKMQKRMREEEMNILRGHDNAGDDDDDEEDEEDEDEEDDGEDEDGEGDGEEDEKGGNERKDGRDGREEGVELDEGEEDEEDEDEDEQKRPSRRGNTGRPVMRGTQRGGVSTGRPKGPSSGSDEMGTDSDGSDLGDDDYF